MQVEESVNLVTKYTQMAIDYLPTVAKAILILIIGFWIIGMVVRFVKNVMAKSGMDISLQKFLGSILSVLLKVMLLFSVAGTFGVDTTSFIALIGALMVGVGMAFNGTIGHFASGVMLMIFKPFKVGDLVTIGSGQTGTVEAINAFNTTLQTLDNKRIIIANTTVTNNDITNISGQEIIGVELGFSIGYGDSIDAARDVIMQVGKECPHILNDPAMGVVVGELGDSGVVLNTRPFCKSEHYWDTFFYMQENVKKALDKAGIEIPYNTVDVNMRK